MSDLRVAAQMALEALVWEAGSEPKLYAPQTAKAITALRATLAQEEQEPVAWMYEIQAVRSSSGIGGWDRQLLFCRPADEPFKRNITPLYTAPPQRKSLTDEEIKRATPVCADFVSFRAGVRFMEREIGAKDE